MVAFLVAALVAVYSWATAKEEIFRELRDNCFKKWNKDETLPFLVRKVCYIPTCEYCTSCWVSLVTIFVFRHQVWFDDWRGYVLAHGLTWACAVAYMCVYQLARVDIRYEQAKADKETMR